ALRQSLPDITVHSGAHGTPDRNVALGSGNDYYARSRTLGKNAASHFFAWHIRQGKIERDDVGPVIAKTVDGLSAAGCMSDHGHIRFIVDDGSQAFLHQLMLVGREYSNQF